jgi:U3 small nucleolar ribonucleoprotein component
LADQRAESRQQELDQENRDRKSDQRKQNRFSQELLDELNPAGTDDLSDSDFPRPAGRSGRGQIHEIYAGDEQDKKGND